MKIEHVKYSLRFRVNFENEQGHSIVDRIRASLSEVIGADSDVYWWISKFTLNVSLKSDTGDFDIEDITARINAALVAERIGP